MTTIDDLTKEKTHFETTALEITMPQFYSNIATALDTINNTTIELKSKDGRRTVYATLGEWETEAKSEYDPQGSINFVIYKRNDVEVKVQAERKERGFLESLIKLSNVGEIIGYRMPDLGLTAPIGFVEKLDDKRVLQEILTGKDDPKRAIEHFYWYVQGEAYNNCQDCAAPKLVYEIGQRLKKSDI